MDDVVADLKVMKLKQWMEQLKERDRNGDRLLSRPRLTQGCSTERKEGISHQDTKDKDHSSAILATAKSL